MKKMNLPNKLTVMRLCLVPVFVAILLISDALWADIAGLVVFCIASLTDMLDGKIARKYHLITDFGKFLDPLADKFMVMGAMLVILYRTLTRPEELFNKTFSIVFFCNVLIFLFRELAVTSMRLVVAGSGGPVIAANMLGKIKTCTQIACVICCIAEPMLCMNIDALKGGMAILPVSFTTSVLCMIFTLWSGINYLTAYWKYLDPEK